MTREEIEELKGLAASMGLYDDKKPCKRAVILGKAIKTLEQEPRWIPVTEDAPPKGTICLWCNKQGSVFTSAITYRSNDISHVGKHGYFHNGLENHGDIVAWMPLPNAYSEVEE